MIADGPLTLTITVRIHWGKKDMVVVWWPSCSADWSLVLSHSAVDCPFILSICPHLFNNKSTYPCSFGPNRPRVPPVSESATPSPTRSASGAVVVPSTARRRLALSAATPLPRPVSSAGARRACAARPPVVAVCNTSRPLPAASRTVSVRVLRPGSRSRPPPKCVLFLPASHHIQAQCVMDERAGLCPPWWG